jgi:PhoPQ-activated pathogenicity-related protein
LEGYETVDKIKIYVEDGKIIVKEPSGTIKCDGAEISGPSIVMQDEDKNVWIETESKVIKVVKIPAQNITTQNEK